MTENKTLTSSLCLNITQVFFLKFDSEQYVRSFYLILPLASFGIVLVTWNLQYMVGEVSIGTVSVGVLRLLF
jgi:hypothetical protein